MKKKSREDDLRFSDLLRKKNRSKGCKQQRLQKEIQKIVTFSKKCQKKEKKYKKKIRRRRP